MDAKRLRETSLRGRRWKTPVSPLYFKPTASDRNYSCPESSFLERIEKQKKSVSRIAIATEVCGKAYDCW